MNLTFFSNDGRPAYLRPDRVDAITYRAGQPEDCLVHLSGGECIAIRGRNPLDMASLLNELCSDAEDALLHSLRGPQGEPGPMGWDGPAGPAGPAGEPSPEVAEVVDALNLRLTQLEQGRSHAMADVVDGLYSRIYTLERWAATVDPIPAGEEESSYAERLDSLPQEDLVNALARRGYFAGRVALATMDSADLLAEVERRVRYSDARPAGEGE